VCVCVRAVNAVCLSWVSCLSSISELYPLLLKFQSLTELEESLGLLRVRRSGDMQATLTVWRQRESQMNTQFSFVEPLLSLRCVLLRSLLATQQSE
jgi:hypothetical protein